jgi:fructose-1,6-bisphosphatase I
MKRFMNEVALLNPELTELTVLFGAIETSCKAISNLVRKSQLPSTTTLGYHQGELVDNNIPEEKRKKGKNKLGGITNDLLKRALRFTGRLGVLASEEEDTPLDFMPNEPADKEVLIDESLKYVAVFDPLDGRYVRLLPDSLSICRVLLFFFSHIHFIHPRVSTLLQFER